MQPCKCTPRAAPAEPVAASAEPCNVVLTTTNCDFDSLAAACALASLWGRDPEFSLVPTHVVMPRGAVPVVQRFLAYHKHVLPVRGFKTIDGSDIGRHWVLSMHQVAARLGRSKRWLSLAQSLHVYDHHVGGEGEESESLGLHATEVVVEPVGSTTTHSRKTAGRRRDPISARGDAIRARHPGGHGRPRLRDHHRARRRRL